MTLQLPRQLRDRDRSILDRGDDPHLTMSSSIRDRRANCLLVHIETNEDSYLFHGNAC